MPVDTSLIDGLREISRKQIGMTAVLDSAGRLLGIFTDGDLRRLLERGGDVRAVKLADVMTRNPLTVPPDMHILKAATVMARRNFRRIPVAEGDKLLGMLSIGDIHKATFFRTLAANFGVHET